MKTTIVVGLAMLACPFGARLADARPRDTARHETRIDPPRSDARHDADTVPRPPRHVPPIRHEAPRTPPKDPRHPEPPPPDPR